MKKVLSVVTCSILAACSCSDNQWEDVDVATYEEPVYEEQTIVETPAPAKVVVEQEPIYTPAPQPAYNCPCAVQPQPCYQAVCYQPCPCMVQPVVVPAPQPLPQPKITTTKKIITTTTTYEEPCGKPVCEPVVSTHEEVIPTEVRYGTPDMSYNGYTQPMASPAPVAAPVMTNTEYRSDIVDMRSVSPKIDANVAAKYSPEAYNVVATRATNRMLQDMSAMYGNNTKTVFLNDTKLLSSDLPYGNHRLKGTTKDIIASSQAFELVNNANSADFIVDSSADWYVANNANPALQYKLAMFDRNGRKINEWIEIIRQVQE